jgi:hypothetical protein
MRVTIFVMIVLMVLVASAAAAAQGEPAAADDDPAREAFQAGVEHYGADRIEEALVEFRRAYELKPTWKILFNIGQCEAALGRYGVALEVFEQYILEGGDEVPNDRRDYVAAEVRRIQPMVGILEVGAPDGTLVRIDGVERKTTPLKGPLRVASGDHRVELVQGEEVLLSDTVSVAGGITTTVAVPGPEPEGPPADQPATEATSAGDQPPPPPKRKKGLLIAGVATFGGGYLFSALVGYLAYSEATVPEGQRCVNCKETGRRMFVPVVGPFWAIEVADGTDGKVVSGLMGAVQVIGLGLTAWGVILYVNSGPPDEEDEEGAEGAEGEEGEAVEAETETARLGPELHPLSRLRLGAAPERGGGMLSLGWTF